MNPNREHFKLTPLFRNSKKVFLVVRLGNFMSIATKLGRLEAARMPSKF